MRNQRFWTCYVSLIATAFFLVWMELIPKWGAWYSPSLPLRFQTEAMRQGHLALSSDPSRMDWDFAWGNGTVQQVWGLGVPAWRFPFEIIAKAIGQPGFPDRLAFALAMAGVIYVLARFHFEFAREICEPANPLWVFLGLLPTALFPPFFALCSPPFTVYAEVGAYGFIAGLLLMAWSTWLWLRPNSFSFSAMALICGLTPLIRPPTGVYGIAALAVAGTGMWRGGRRIRVLCLGAGLYLAGIALLLHCNTVRFGSWKEFGYALNVNSLSEMSYAQRFDSPYRSAPLTTAALEFFGLLFLSRSADPGHSYDFGRFPGESHIFRWRDLYFSTYDVSIFIVVLVVWGWLAWRVWRRLRRRKELVGSGILEVVALWSVLSAVPLLVFYLRFPFISSRYLLDFGPSFAAACWVFVWSVFRCVKTFNRGNRPWRSYALPTMILLGWWGGEMAVVQNGRTRNDSRTWDQVSSEMEAERLRPPHQSIPTSYTNGFPFAGIGIPFNGVGWESPAGITQACVSLFVENPNCLWLEVEPATASVASTTSFYDRIQAKIGLEYLKRSSIALTPSGASIIFEGPSQRKYQTGIQLASLAMISPQELSNADSRFRLLKVSWHRDETSRNSK